MIASDATAEALALLEPLVQTLDDSSDELEALAPGNLVEALNQLPQFLNNSGPANVSSIGGAAGSSFLNLRGVGSNRTLVLLDGRRVASSTRAGVADVATFPEAMIRGMEVVTGGASAAYGSDAVGGVVNFLLDTDFTGVKGKVQGGMTSRQDNENFEISLSAGHRLGERTHLLASFDYTESKEIRNYEGRDWYQNWGTDDVNGRGQPTVIARDVRSRLYTAGGLIRMPGPNPENSALHMIHFLEGGIPAQFQDGTLVGETRQVGGTGFWGDIASKEQDTGGQGSIYPDNSRGSAFLYLDHEFNNNWTGFAQFIYGSNNTEFNGSGAHQEEAWALTIYEENPFIPPSIRDVMEMRSGVQYEERYDFDNPGVAASNHIAALVRNTARFADVARTLPQQAAPGTTFQYKTIDTAVLGWLIERVTRGSVAAYTARCLWEPLGAEADGFYIMDGPPGVGREFSGAGFNATLRDFARVGQMMLNGGVANGRRIVPEEWVRESVVSRHPEDAQRGGYGLQWWTMGGSDAYAAIGLQGQYIYVDPATRTVVVKLSHFPPGDNSALEAESQAFMRAAAAWQP